MCKFGEYCLYAHKTNPHMKSLEGKIHAIEQELKQKFEDICLKLVSVKEKRKEMESKIVMLEEKCDGRLLDAPNSEHNSAQTEAAIESLKAVSTEQNKKLSDYIVESFVRFNGVENKLEEVIDFVNVNVSNASQISTASRKPTTASRQNPKNKDFT